MVAQSLIRDTCKQDNSCQVNYPNLCCQEPPESLGKHPEFWLFSGNLVIYFAPVNSMQKRYWRWASRKHETGKSKAASRRGAEIAEEDQSKQTL